MKTRSVKSSQVSALGNSSGEAEATAFADLPEFPQSAAAHICHLVLMKLVPGMKEADIAAFGEVEIAADAFVDASDHTAHQIHAAARDHCKCMISRDTSQALDEQVEC